MDAKQDLEHFRGYLRVLADMQLHPRVRGKEDVSDVVQVTLVQAYLGIDGFRGSTEAELRAWLKTILTHTLINLSKKYRTKKRDVLLERSIDQQLQESAIRIAGEPVDDQSSPSQVMIRQERAEQLAHAMADLLEDECRAVMLKHVHNWKVAEIAAHLERTPDAVAGLLRRGLKKLRRSMEEPAADE